MSSPQVNNRDPLTIVAVVIGIVINIGSLAWYGGKLEQRQTVTEAQVNRLEAKAEVDAVQNTQIAVVTTQLGMIQSDVGEIKATVKAIQAAKK